MRFEEQLVRLLLISLSLCPSPSVAHQKTEKEGNCIVSLELNLSQLKAVLCQFND